MGWSSGANLAEDVWNKVKLHVPEIRWDDLAFEIFDLFCDEDADDWHEEMSIVQDSQRIQDTLNGD